MPTAKPKPIRVSLAGAEPALAADLARAAAGRRGGLPLVHLLDLANRADEIRRAYSGEGRPGNGVVLLGRSVRVGGATLRSISLGGAIALRLLVSWAEWFDQETYDVAEAWVYANSWSLAAMARLTDPAAAAEIVAEWFPCLTCTREELAAAVDLVRGPAARPAETGEAANPGDPARLLDGLMVRFGGAETRWLETPIERLAALADGAKANDRAREAELSRASGTLPPAIHDERVNAVAAYARARERITSPTSPTSPTPEPEA